MVLIPSLDGRKNFTPKARVKIYKWYLLVNSGSWVWNQVWAPVVGRYTPYTEQKQTQS